MQLTLSGQLKQFLRAMQSCLFPKREEQLGLLTDRLQQLIAVLELVQIEDKVGPWRGGVGRPPRMSGRSRAPLSPKPSTT